MFDYAKFQNAALAIIATLVMTTVSVGAAVGPAEVGTTPAYIAAAGQVGNLA